MVKKSIYPYGAGGLSPTSLITHTGFSSDAVSYAQQHEDEQFVWLLQDVDEHDNSFTKMIWHVGNGVFIDSVGSIIIDSSDNS